MTNSAGTAFVDLEPRFGPGWAASIRTETARVGTAGTAALSGFATQGGRALSGLDARLAGFGVPFTGQLGLIGRELQKTEAGLTSSASAAARFKSVGTAAFLGVGAAAVALGTKSIHTFLEGQEIQAQLANSIRNTGHALEDYSHGIEGAVSAGAKLGFNQEEVEAGLNKITRATHDPDKALRQLGLAEDIARAKGIDLAAAGQIVANADAGRTRGLVTLGVALKDSTGRTLTATEALTQAAAITKGAAAESADTYAGKLRTLGAEAHNLEENIGGELVPVVANLAHGLELGGEGLAHFNDLSGGWLGRLSAIALAGGATVIAVDKIGAGVSKLAGYFKATTVATTAETGALIANTEATVANAEANLELGFTAADTEIVYAGLTGAIDSATIASAGLTSADAAQTEVFLALGGAAEDAALGVETLATAEKDASVSAGFLGASVSGAAAAGGLLIGVLGGVQIGNAINKSLGGAKPNVDELTGSFEALAESEKIGGKLADTYGGNLQKLAGDLKTIEGSSIEKAFGLAPSAHRAVKDISAAQDALIGVLKEKGPEEATLAFGRMSAALIKDGVSAQDIGPQFHEFITLLDDARAKANATTGASTDLAGALDTLATKTFAKRSSQLGIADAFEAVRQARKDLAQAELDAQGKGDKAIAARKAEVDAATGVTDALYNEAQARRGVTDAITAEHDATLALEDAKRELASFESGDEARIRALEHQNLVARIVTTPEEARQKEIDLLQFGIDTAAKRADLTKKVEDAQARQADGLDKIASAQHGVTEAHQRTIEAQQKVTDAAKASALIQSEAAATVEAAHRKVEEAIIDVVTQVDKANSAWKFGDATLGAYVGHLDELRGLVKPGSPLDKGLSHLQDVLAGSNAPSPTELAARLPSFLSNAHRDLLINEGSPGFQGPVSAEDQRFLHDAGVPGFEHGGRTPGSPLAAELAVLHGGETVTPAHTDTKPSVYIDARQTVHVSGGADLEELEVSNRKQAMRLAAAGLRG